MHRRTFLLGCAGTAVLRSRYLLSAAGNRSADTSALDGLIGKPVNIAPFGEVHSWTKSETNRLRSTGPNTDTDFGVEWPEFRTLDKVIARFNREAEPVRSDQTYLEYWSGLSRLQGEWKSYSDWAFLAPSLKRSGGVWEYDFRAVRTCKVRLRVQGQPLTGNQSLEAYGPSIWKSGEIYIQWNELGGESFDGHIEVYNGYLISISPFGNTQVRGQNEWVCPPDRNRISGIVAKVMYTSGLDVDRTILTIRAAARGFSFLPGEIVENGPLEVPDFGVYLCDNLARVDLAGFRKQNAGRLRIIDAVSRIPEQTLAHAQAHIHAERVPLSFVGVDSNNQKFGISPLGHAVIGSNDPRGGRPMQPKFGVFFDSSQREELFEDPGFSTKDLFSDSRPQKQELLEAWLPIIVTHWSNNDVSFERTDYAVLAGMTSVLDESGSRGDEPAVMISHLRIINNSPVPQRVNYLIKPWKPAPGDIPWPYSFPSAWGPPPSGRKNAWALSLRENIAFVAEGTEQLAIFHVDTHGRGSVSIVAEVDSVRFTDVLRSGEEISIHVVIPGIGFPEDQASRLRTLDYDALLKLTVHYWRDLLAKGANVDIPDPHIQALFNANLQHYLLAMTKDSERQEHYPNVAMFEYGSIGSESSPIMQAMDLLGLHSRVESCLEAWFSTQGDCIPDGDYSSKEGGFYHFWPIYTTDQGGVLWAIAEHYLYTRDHAWLKKVSPQIVSGCDFILRERKRTITDVQEGKAPLYSGLAPAGCDADMRDWEYSFMLNAYFYLALKKSAEVLADVDPQNSKRIAAEADDYRQVIRRVFKECVAISPVQRLRDNTGVSTAPSYVGLRGLSSDVKDSVDPDKRHGYGYDVTCGPFHLLKAELLEPNEAEVTWMLNYFEDRFFLFSPLNSRVDLSEMSTDWFDLGGYEKLQPYYVHYQDAYLDRDQIPHFLRGFFNTLLALSDPMTLTFEEALDNAGSQPHKTHEEAWFFHQLRFMLVKETGNDLFFARGTPREWLQHGKRIAVSKAPTYFGEVSYSIVSDVDNRRIQANVNPPTRQRPDHIYLRLRHPLTSPIRQVFVNGRAWSVFSPEKEWIELPVGEGEMSVLAEY